MAGWGLAAEVPSEVPAAVEEAARKAVLVARLEWGVPVH